MPTAGTEKATPETPKSQGVQPKQKSRLARFAQIDYDREIALVSIDKKSLTDNILGVARIIGDAHGRAGEFAVLVGDAWQGKGIGGNLLEKCFFIGEKQSFKTVHGIVLKGKIRTWSRGGEDGV
jgi:N-acetylglutamate synthase-like GNAT family acetyltransferase